MSVDYIVASLPPLKFGESPALTWEKFEAAAEGVCFADILSKEWAVLETALKNALVELRAADRHRQAEAAKYLRDTPLCTLYWKNRILDAYKIESVAKRDEAIDRVFWDAAGELTPPASPLGLGALATYAVRLKIALRRALISAERGNAAFDRLTASTKIEF